LVRINSSASSLLPRTSTLLQQRELQLDLSLENSAALVQLNFLRLLLRQLLNLRKLIPVWLMKLFLVMLSLLISANILLELQHLELVKIIIIKIFLLIFFETFVGLPIGTPVTNVNKVCSSGMKAVMLGA